MADSIDPGKLPQYDYGDDGGNSGPGGDIRDARPEYSPAMLVTDVMAMFSALGIPTHPDTGAPQAAARLLRRLGIRPVSTPEDDA